MPRIGIKKNVKNEIAMQELAQLLMSVAGFGVPLGIMLLMAGRVKIRNEMDTLIRVISAFCVTMVCYWIVGQGLFHGDSVQGLFGLGWSAFSQTSLVGEVGDLRTIFLFSVPPIMATTAMVERGSFLAGNFLVAVVAIFVTPVVAHWAWYSEPDLKGWLAYQGFIDDGGAVVIFAAAAFVAIATSITLGPRMGRFPVKTDRPSGQSPTYHALGMILIVFGIAMVTAGHLDDLKTMSATLFKVLLGVSFAVMSALILLVVRRKDGASLDLMASALAGAVALSAFAPHTSPANAALAGLFAGSVSIGLRRVFLATEVDDPGDLAAAFLAGGLTGGLLSPVLFAVSSQSLINQLSVQLIGLITIAIWSFLLPYGVAQALMRASVLRVSEGDEARGLSRAHFGLRSEADFLVSQIAHGASIENVQQEGALDHQNALAENFSRSIATLRSEAHRATDRIRASMSDARKKTTMINRIRLAEDTLRVKSEDILLMLESSRRCEHDQINGVDFHQWLVSALEQVLDPAVQRLAQFARHLPLQVELEELETTVLAASDEIARSAHKMELLLDYASAQMRGFYSRDHVCDLAQLLSDHSIFLRSLADVRQSPIQIDCPVSSGYPVSGDANAFKRILSLVVEAALNRLGGQDSQPVRIELRQTSSSHHVQLECLDTGTALTRRQIRAILDPVTSGERLEELGINQILPLMLTARLVEAMGGDITLTSQQGIGTVIHCQFRKLTTQITKSRSGTA